MLPYKFRNLDIDNQNMYKLFQTDLIKKNSIQRKKKNLFFLFLGCSVKLLFKNIVYILGNHSLVYHRNLLSCSRLFIPTLAMCFLDLLICSTLFFSFTFDDKFVNRFIDLKIFNVNKNKSRFFYQKIKFCFKHSFIKMNQFLDLTAVDLLGQHKFLQHRFCLIYIYFSTYTKTKFFFSLFCSLSSQVRTLTEMFNCVGWAERECFDMFGIKFQGNLDLRRILTDYGFRGFPLRKDFPVTGFLQVKFDEIVFNVVYEKLNLMQMEREITFVNPWSFSNSEFLFEKNKKMVLPLKLHFVNFDIYNFVYKTKL